jgi:hypothetical protein
MRKMRDLYLLVDATFAKQYRLNTLGTILIYAAGISLGMLLLMDLTWNSQEEEAFFLVENIRGNMVSGSFRDGSTETLISESNFQTNREYPVEIRGFKHPLLYRKVYLIEY